MAPSVKDDSISHLEDGYCVRSEHPKAYAISLIQALREQDTPAFEKLASLCGQMFTDPSALKAPESISAASSTIHSRDHNNNHRSIVDHAVNSPRGVLSRV
jgi:hypothetical protein